MEDTTRVESDTVLFLTFKVAQEVLAFEVSKVREVLEMCPITRVPRTPDYMKGVINLRGTVIPVLDLRTKFGMSKTKHTVDARIVIIEFDLDGVQVEAGIFTDSVHEVIGISEDQIGPPPETGSNWRKDFIRGIGKYGDSFILLLDVQRVFDQNDNLIEAV